MRCVTLTRGNRGEHAGGGLMPCCRVDPETGKRDVWEPSLFESKPDERHDEWRDRAHIGRYQIVWWSAMSERKPN